MYAIERALATEPDILARDWQSDMPRTSAKAIKEKKQVTFIGTGSSYHVALWSHWACQEAAKGAIKSRAITTWDFLLEASLASKEKRKAGKRKTAPRHLFVVISHRGNQGMTQRALEIIAKQPHVLICGAGAPVQSHPHLFESATEVSNAHSMSLIGGMSAVSEILATIIPAADGKRLRFARQATARILRQLSSDSEWLMPLARTIGTSPKPVFHFIGGGPLHAVALELRLKTQEIQHCPAQAYNIEEFLHGPIAALEKTDLVAILPPAGRTGHGFLQANRLTKCREAAEAIGALVIEPVLEPVLGPRSSIESLPLYWQAVPNLFWGQKFCVNLAKLWDIDPDSNRREDPRYEEARIRIEAP